MTTKEIITLQLGNYSNFIGAHFWNFQESTFIYDDSNDPEVNHDVLFREGLTHNGHVTYTPRLVLAELKGGLGSLKVDGDLYGDEFDEEDIEEDCKENLWHEKISKHIAEPVSKSERFDIKLINGIKDNEVIENGTSQSQFEYNEYWPDFMRMHVHKNSNVIINEYSHNPIDELFSLWSQGTEMQTSQVFEHFEEKIRFFAEECDSLQGFHMLSDIHNGFGGLSYSLTNYLKDEFKNKSISIFASQPPQMHSETYFKKIKRAISSSLAFSSLLENASMICPMSVCKDFNNISAGYREFPHLIYDVNSYFHTSSILAAAIENSTLSYRSVGSFNTAFDMISDVTPGKRNILSMFMSLPVPICINTKSLKNSLPTNLSEFLSNPKIVKPWIELTPCITHQEKHDSKCFSQTINLRGIPETCLYKNEHEYYNGSNNGKSLYSTEDIVDVFAREEFPGSKNHIYVANESLKISPQFPKIFKKNVGKSGFIITSEHNKTNSIYGHKNDTNGNGMQDDKTENRYLNYSSKNFHKSFIQNGCNSRLSNKFVEFNNQKDVSLLQNVSSAVNSVPVFSTLQCSSNNQSFIKSAKACLAAAKMSFYYQQQKIEIEDLEVYNERLNKMYDLYSKSEDCYSSDTDTE